MALICIVCVRQVAFDRLLARMFDPSQPARDGWVLKGGYALEMRFHIARSTKDLDLTVRSAQGREADATSLRERLQLAASIELPDFFTFIVGEAMAELNQAPEGGARFPVDARLDGRTFVKFHVDLGVGDEVLEPLERVEGEDWLGFAGIPAVVVPALSVEQHWAEKFHAYTRPRETPNSRVRDLVDLVLILEHEAPATERVRMGHASSRITLDLYGHLFKETSESAMRRLTMRIRGAKGGQVVALATGTDG
jgi:hypothetical protein